MGIRATWSGVIGFGMVVIPVKMGRATVSEAQSFHQVHTEDGCGGRVRYRKYCEACGKDDLQVDQTGRGAESATGETVMLTAEDEEALPQAARKRADVQYFCPAAEIDPVALDSAYWLWPDRGGEKAYQLMHDALAGAGKVAVCSIVIRTRESLAVIMPRSGRLMLVTMYWPSEVRQPDALPSPDGQDRPSEPERKLAASLVEIATQAFDPAQHKDAYSEAVRALVDARGGTAPRAGSGTQAGLELMDALKGQLAAAREARKAQPRKTRARSKSQAGAA